MPRVTPPCAARPSTSTCGCGGASRWTGSRSSATRPSPSSCGARRLRDAVPAGLVAPVPGFDQRVGPEGDERLGGKQLVERALVGDVVEVVHPLVPLVAHPAVLLELLRTRHARHRSAGHVQRSYFRWPKEALCAEGTRSRPHPRGWLAWTRQVVRQPR